MTMLQLTEANFDEVVQGAEYLLIEFSAEWCGPCKGYQKVLQACAEEFPSFTFAAVDIDQQSALAEEFQVRSVPATMILRNSVVVCAQTGAMTKAALVELLQQTQQLDPEELTSNDDD